MFDIAMNNKYSLFKSVFYKLDCNYLLFVYISKY